MLVGKDYARLGSAGWLNWDLSANMVIKKKKKKKRKGKKKKNYLGSIMLYTLLSLFSYECRSSLVIVCVYMPK